MSKLLLLIKRAWRRFLQDLDAGPPYPLEEEEWAIAQQDMKEQEAANEARERAKQDKAAP